ncbi:MAG TPA: glycosyl hydrolase [Pseudonocardia sp.]
MTTPQPGSPRNRTRRRGYLAAATALVLAGGLVAAIDADAAPQPLALGVTSEDATGAAAFAATAGVPAAIQGWYESWAGDTPFDTARADAVRASGALPMLTWEPWTPGAGVDQPEYALGRIAEGDYDAYITAFAQQVHGWGGVLALRFAHELDAPTYPWGAGVNGNSPANAVAAWRHVHDLFAAAGADVVWVWCVNVHVPDASAYAPLYPGDDDVDWVALDGYNGGTALPWGGWRTPREVFGDSLQDLRGLSAKPAVITEVGTAEDGGAKADWIHELFTFVTEQRVRALVWFDVAKEADWRIDSSPAAAAAFRAEAGVPGRLGPPPLPDRFVHP